MREGEYRQLYLNVCLASPADRREEGGEDGEEEEQDEEEEEGVRRERQKKVHEGMEREEETQEVKERKITFGLSRGLVNISTHCFVLIGLSALLQLVSPFFFRSLMW